MTAPQAQADCEQAEPFEAFYHRRFAGMVRLAYCITGPGPHLEELVQDSFAAVYGAYERREIREPEFYLKRTVVNRCRRWKGMQARRREHEIVTELETDAIDRPSADIRFEDTTATRDALWEALGRLSANQRAAIVLHFYEDMGFESIAEVMRDPDGPALNLVTVRSWVHRGLARLHKEMTL